MKKYILYLVLSLVLFAGCSDSVIGYESREAYVETLAESNVIYYTTSDGKMIKPTYSEVFATKVVSNDYEDGLGVMTFDRPINEIGANMFAGCMNLVSITLPYTVAKIGKGAFKNCTSLRDVSLAEITSIIDDDAFCNCFAITSFTIPQKMKRIGSRAFSGCLNLSEISIPDGVTYIGDEAFCQCSLIESMVIPDSVIEMGGGVFKDCSALTSVTLEVKNSGELRYIMNRLASIPGVSGVSRNSK